MFSIPNESAIDINTFHLWHSHTQTAWKKWKLLNCSSSTTDPNGSLNTDPWQPRLLLTSYAILQYPSTPEPNTQLSSTQCTFGWPIKDFRKKTKMHTQPLRCTTDNNHQHINMLPLKPNPTSPHCQNHPPCHPTRFCSASYGPFPRPPVGASSLDHTSHSIPALKRFAKTTSHPNH